MRVYGVRIYRYGVVFHGDRRHRRPSVMGGERIVPWWVLSTPRQGKVVDGRYVLPRLPGKRWLGVVERGAPGVAEDGNAARLLERWRKRKEVRARKVGMLSRSSAKYLALVAANAKARFRSHVTLTYRANVEAWEGEAQRNARVVRRSKRDLNRFFSAMRDELGAYLWAQEFQARGVIHFHVLAEREVERARVALVWCKAIGALEDPDALAHGAELRRITDEGRARSYVGLYLRKANQKVLPAGVAGAGRWWGRSRSLELDLVAEVVSCDPKSEVRRDAEVRVARCVRKFIGRVFRRRTLEDLKAERDRERRRLLRERLGRGFKSGWFVNWGGELAGALAKMVERWREYYGVTGAGSELAGECEAVGRVER